MSASRYLNNDLRWRAGDHPDQTVLTPAVLLEPIRAVLGGIELDPATTPDNPTRARRFYALPENDGLALPWDADRIFLNAPYGAAREPFMRRAAREAEAGRHIVAIVPNTTETIVFQETTRTCTSAVLVDGRVVFDYPDGSSRSATHGSIILGWNVDLEPLGDLGLVWAPLATFRPGARRAPTIEFDAHDIGGKPCGTVRRAGVGLLYYTPEAAIRVRVLDTGRDPNAYEVNLMLEAIQTRYPERLLRLDDAAR